MSSPRLITLPGGLTLATLERGGPPILAARLWMAHGSGLDPTGARGAHQLLAGVLTRGCGQLSAESLADLVEGRGAALRAEASEDNLLISLKCATEDGATLLPLLLQMASSPRLEPDQIELERQLNVQSLQRQREDPFQLCHEALRSQIYSDGPYGHDPLGVIDELEAIPLSQLQSLVGTLGQRGAVLVVSGHLDGDLDQLLASTLNQLPWTPARPGHDLPLAVDTTSGPSLELLEQDTEQLVLMLGCATPPLAHPDSLPLRLLQAHLGLGMSSRLFLVMREERGLAYDVGVHMPARRASTPTIWHLSSSAERAGEACTALLDEWQRVLEVPLSAAELHLAQAKYLGQDAMGRQTCGQIAERHALLLGFGLPADFIETSLQRAAQLSAEEVLAVAQRWLVRPHLSLCGSAPALEAAATAWRKHGLNAHL